MLSQVPDLEIVGEAAGGYAGVEMALALVPDLVLMDVDMPDLNGIEATRRLLARQPDIKVLAHSAGSGWHVVREMLFAGASGYLVKGGDPDELAEAIRVVLAGDRFLSGKIKLPLLSPLAPQHGANIGGGPGLSAAAAVQVVLVDDSSIVRQRLAGLLSTQEGVALAGQAADVAAGLAQLRERKVDVLVSGLHLREESGLDLIQIAKQ
jgi:DNA-binding NarL/FixJ family response regulator